MNITSLTVENFKCYKEATTAEFAPITLIYGENGGGKSTLIQALQTAQTLLQDSSEKSLAQHARRTPLKDQPSSIHLQHGDELEYTIQYDAKKARFLPVAGKSIGAFLNSIFALIEQDLPKLREDFEKNYEHNLMVLSIVANANEKIEASKKNFNHFFNILSKCLPFGRDAEHGYGDSFGDPLILGGVKPDSYYRFGDGEASKFLESEDINKINASALSEMNFIRGTLIEGNFKEYTLKKSDFLPRIFGMRYEETASPIPFFTSVYLCSSKVQVAISGTRWDEQYSNIAEDSLNFHAQISPLYTIMDFAFIKEIAGPKVKTSDLDTFQLINIASDNKFHQDFKTMLNRSCESIVFMDQPRGYQSLLAMPLNAKLKRNLDPLLRDLFPDVSFDIRADGGQRDIFIYDDILGAEVPAVECGFGYSQILPILLALADSDNEVVCISEPESHIHPRLQAGIGSLFLDVYRKSGKQIIAETHSEHIVLRIQRLIRCGEMKPEEVSVLYVSKTPEGSTIKRLHLDEKGRFIDAWPQGFFAERDEEFFGGKPA